jgi:lysophospholipase L1-like esterase
MRRAIRLKEWGIGIDVQRTPDAGAIERSDPTLGADTVRFRTDADGFIASGFAHAPGDDDIIVLGDSVVECMFLHEGRRLSDRCELALRRRGIAARVRNGGASGTTSLHLLNMILAKIVPLRPRALVILNGVIDIDVSLKSGGFWSRDAYLNPLKCEPEPPPGAVEPLVAMDLSDRTRMLELIGETCDRFGLPLAFATFAHRGRDDYAIARGAWFEELSAKRGAVNANTRNYCAAAGRACIDLENQFAGRADLFYDQFHLNHEGARVIGEALAERLAGLFFASVPGRLNPRDGSAPASPAAIRS